MPPSKLSKAATTDVLSDIPLLCEGVVGIGIFTFLFLVKKVCRMSIFLHGSSFLTFIAATLDLSRVVTLGSTVEGDKNAQPFIIASEVLFSLAYPLLNLYFWELVAKRPRSEAIPVIVSNKRKWHSASWDRWGIPGEALKWVSLATLLTVPALQLVWRLAPAQGRHSAVYVADSVLDTTLSMIFIVRFLFNAYGSLSKPFWQALRPHLAPILTLLINIGLSIGSLPCFKLAKSPLGHSLQAIGVYILLVYNLYTTFQDVVDSTLLIDNKRRNGPVASSAQYFGKENAQATDLDPRYRGQPFRPQSSSLSYLRERASQQDVNRAEPLRLSSERVDRTSSFWETQDWSRSSIAARASSLPSRLASFVDFSTMQTPSLVIRPDSSILTSNVYSVQDTKQASAHALEVPSTQFVPPSTAFDKDTPEDSESVSSLDNLLGHRDDMDKSIAAPRELSPPCSGLFHPRPVLLNTIEDSRSNNSTLSELSKFPNPPSNLNVFDAVGSNRVVTFRQSQPSSQRRRKRITEFRPLPITGSSITLSEILRPGSLLRTSTPGSTGTQWDVTSFIGDLTDPTSMESLVRDELSGQVNDLDSA